MFVVFVLNVYLPLTVLSPIAAFPSSAQGFGFPSVVYYFRPDNGDFSREHNGNGEQHSASFFNSIAGRVGHLAVSESGLS
mgnify:CR=1 FL=1